MTTQGKSHKATWNGIHDSFFIGPNVTLIGYVEIGYGAVITGRTIIRHGTSIAPHAVIGTPPEKHGFFDYEGAVEIGENCIIREGVTINASTNVMKPTKLEDGVIMLRGVHVGHDVHIGAKSIVSCNAILGGHSILGEGCNIALGAILHQFSVIGAWSMVGMGCIITKKTRVTPGGVYVGNPAKYLKPNTIGLQRAGITEDMLQGERLRWIKSLPESK